MDIIEAFEQGRVPGFGLPEKTIETQLSKVFLYPDTVVKAYKKEKYFFADLSSIEGRKKFYEDDFLWNNTASPLVYHTLGEHEGEHFFVMNRIDTENTITNLLLEDRVETSHIDAVTDLLVQTIRTLTNKKLADYAHVADRGWVDIWNERLEVDLPEWAKLASPHVSMDEVQSILKKMKEYSAIEPYFNPYDSSLLSIQADNNCDNFLIINDEPHLIDSMPPKEAWRVFDEAAIVARTAVDAYVLGSEKLGDAVYTAYEKYRTGITDTAKILYEINAGMIQWPYRHMIGQHDLAEKFRLYVLKRLEKLGN